MDRKEGLEHLKRAIRERVLVTKETHQIVSSRGAEHNWLFDFRAISLDGAYLPLIAELFWERYASRYPFQVGGQETAAIALVAAIVMKGAERGTPVNGFFLRKSRKKEGLAKIVEGTLTDDPIILVDDLVNSGSTFNRQIEVLKKDGKHIAGLFAILSFRAKSAYAQLSGNSPFETLFTLEDFDMPLLPAKSPEVPQKAFEVLWYFKSENPSYHLVVEKSAPALDDTKLYVGSDQGVMWALNQDTGSVAWKYKVGLFPKGKGILSNPGVWNGAVYFGAYDGNVYALDAETGKRKWVFMEADWIGSSPALAPDLGLLFVGLEFGLFRKKGGIAALSLETGKKSWDFRLPELTHCSPLYIKEEGLVVIGGNEQMVHCFDAKSGALRWQFHTEGAGGDVKSSFSYDAKRRLIVFGALDGKAYALDARTGEKKFAHETGAGIYSTPLVNGDVAYVASLDKNLYCIELDTGKERWKHQAAGRIFASPALADGSLWIGANDGKLYELNPETGALVSFFQATERIVNRIAYNPDTKRIFLPTFANEMYALRKLSPES